MKFSYSNNQNQTLMQEHIKELATIQEYKDYINDLASKDLDEVFFNSSAQHASLVMETIFNKSSTINLFAGSLSGEVSGNDNYRKALFGFLDRGGKIRLMLQSQKLDKQIPGYKPSIFKILHFFEILKPGSVQVRKGNFKVVEGDSDDEFHFMTGDDLRYRIENNIDNFSATGNFNDKATVEKLNKVFEKVFNKGEELSLTEVG